VRAVGCESMCADSVSGNRPREENFAVGAWKRERRAKPPTINEAGGVRGSRPRGNGKWLQKEGQPEGDESIKR